MKAKEAIHPILANPSHHSFLGFPSFPIPIVLFGFGEWCRKRWFPILLVLARWQIVYLTVVATREVPPSELAAMESEGVLTYLPFRQLLESAERQKFPWKFAFVIASSESHLSICRTLIEHAPFLRAIICEKPFGTDSREASEVIAEAEARGILIMIADHFLLRPPIEYLMKNPELIRSLGDIKFISAHINEQKRSGPHLSTGVVCDMLVHMLDILAVLFPGGFFEPETTAIGRAFGAETSKETYCLTIGRYVMPEAQPIPCQIEGGKQLPDDKKDLIIGGTTREGTTRTMEINLFSNTLRILNGEHEEVNKQWEQDWTYAKLLLGVIFGQW